MEEINIDEFKRKYPKLAEELLSNKTPSIKLKFSVESIDPWRGYIPTVVDYIRRCKTIEEAYEVIDYLVRRGELSSDEAEKLRKTLKEKGLDAFGKKEDNYYYKQAKKYWSKIRENMKSPRKHKNMVAD